MYTKRQSYMYIILYIIIYDIIFCGKLCKFANQSECLLQGAGNYTTCRHLLTPLLNRSAICKRRPCTMNGLHLPPINFSSTEFIGKVNLLREWSLYEIVRLRFRLRLIARLRVYDPLDYHVTFSDSSFSSMSIK